jgi:hypothetical protein
MPLRDIRYLEQASESKSKTKVSKPCRPRSVKEWSDFPQLVQSYISTLRDTPVQFTEQQDFSTVANEEGVREAISANVFRVLNSYGLLECVRRSEEKHGCQPDFDGYGIGSFETNEGKRTKQVKPVLFVVECKTMFSLTFNFAKVAQYTGNLLDAMLLVVFVFVFF